MEPQVPSITVGEQARSYSARTGLFELPPPVALEPSAHLQARCTDRQVGGNARPAVADPLKRRCGRIIVQLDPLVAVRQIAAHRAPASAIARRAGAGYGAVTGVEHL